MSRDNEPVIGQWYENLDDEETFRVLSVDEDAEVIEIEYLDGELDELDLDEWQDLDLELIDEPEGWSEDEDDEDEDFDEDDEEEDEDDDEDDDWDDDEDDDGRER